MATRAILRGIAAAALLALLNTSCSAEPKGRGETKPSDGPTKTTPIGAFSTRTLDVEGTSRLYGLFIPSSVTGPAPVVVVLHALDLNPADGGASSKLVSSAKANGYVLVTPIGIDASWNAGTCCLPAVAKAPDDVRFVADVIRALIDDHTALAQRVYVAGFSNGAMLAYRIGCEASDVVAGVAVVEGVMTVSTCAPTDPTDLIAVHQTGDLVVPYAGTETSKLTADGHLPSATESFRRWAKGFTCALDGNKTVQQRVSVARYACASGAKAEFVVVTGGDHSWPDAATGFDSVTAIVDFFGLIVAQP